jgi:ribosomal protein S8
MKESFIMVKTILIVSFFMCYTFTMAQSSQISNDLKIVFNYYEMAFDNIKTGQRAINYCYTIRNASQLRTQILYACTSPSNAKKHIDNAINQIYRVEQSLKNLQCPMAYNNSKYTRSLFESARENLQLGFLSFMAASEKRYTKDIYNYMNNGLPFWDACLSDLNNAVDKINEIIEEVNNCNKSNKEKTSISYSCDEIYEFIKSNGINMGKINKYTLNSSWLNEVEAYNYEQNYFIVAKIKGDNDSSLINSYIFCSIPQTNWNNFKFGNKGTYGERFHEYIFNYKCNCD